VASRDIVTIEVSSSGTSITSTGKTAQERCELL
jgi:hypothetical protein